MSILNGKELIISDVQEVSHTSNAAQLTCMKSLDKNCLSWIIDSGATDQMCCQPSLFDYMQPLAQKKHSVRVPDGRIIKVKCSGNITLKNGICLREVLYIPDFNYNLISMQKLCTNLECCVFFNAKDCVIQEQS